MNPRWKGPRGRKQERKRNKGGFQIPRNARQGRNEPKDYERTRGARRGWTKDVIGHRVDASGNGGTKRTRRRYGPRENEGKVREEEEEPGVACEQEKERQPEKERLHRASREFAERRTYSRAMAGGREGALPGGSGAR